MNPQNPPFWSLPAAQVLQQLQSTTIEGLSRQDAKQRLCQYGANSLKLKQGNEPWMLLLNQFNSPMTLLSSLSSFL